MSFKDSIRGLTPKAILDWNRRRKKENRNKVLATQKKAGKSQTKSSILQDLKAIGIIEGDTLLVHSALSKIGHLEEGAKTFVEALIEAVGDTGHILMPTSPNNVYQLNYIRNTPFFDVRNSPSKTGKITEYFRLLEGSIRSIHPTEPVSAYGPNKNDFVNGHFKALTPYDNNSPFYKVGEAKGKILYVGVTLDMAGTSLHTLEDAIDNFKFPVYYPEIFDFDVIDYEGVKHNVKTKVHNPEFSDQRKCDDLIPLFQQAGVLDKVQIGEANTLLVDAKGFFETMIQMYNENGITMYTPKGNVI